MSESKVEFFSKEQLPITPIEKFYVYKYCGRIKNLSLHSTDKKIILTISSGEFLCLESFLKDFEEKIQPNDEYQTKLHPVEVEFFKTIHTHGMLRRIYDFFNEYFIDAFVTRANLIKRNKHLRELGIKL